ncbi:hypothetical protein GOB94_14115 [Granulicella sp. 5B5]|uniref:DUF6950 family protein n=1 Tax=Granulicella sp. 5B5 TaxID=1617967 RepID=UPI0015F55AC7|nr:hypothetical protein [Granulicella sp. 5B5]QMV19701.1 hypothetical protein GOB94_14115 [Granulicella sp. 5B5]
MPLKRSKTWEAHPKRGAGGDFENYLKANRSRPFEWGQHDCCTSAANAIQSYTGIDIASDFRGKYSNLAGALATIKTVTGGTTIADAAAWVANKFGLVEWTHPLCAQRGDLVLLNQTVDGQLETIAGVVHLNGSQVVCVNDKGFVMHPHLAVVRAWKV